MYLENTYFEPLSYHFEFCLHKNSDSITAIKSPHQTFSPFAEVNVRLGHGKHFFKLHWGLDLAEATTGCYLIPCTNIPRSKLPMNHLIKEGECEIYLYRKSKPKNYPQMNWTFTENQNWMEVMKTR